MGIGAGNSTSRRGSRVAGKKDYTNFNFDPTVLFVCIVFFKTLKRSVIVLFTMIKLLTCYLIYILLSTSN